MNQDNQSEQDTRLIQPENSEANVPEDMQERLLRAVNASSVEIEESDD